VSKISGPIECTSLVPRIAINLGYSDLVNIEGDVPAFGLDHFIHTHILREEPDYSVSMLYGRKAIWLPNPVLRLYSCESLTLQFDRMGEACHNFTGPPHTRSELVWRQHSRPRLHRRLALNSPSGTLGMEVATRVTRRVVVSSPPTLSPSLASVPGPPPLSGTLTSTLLWSGTSIMRLTNLSARWKGFDDTSDGWMILHTCKQRCKFSSTHRPV
jgi:hypothetical protein